MRAAGLALALIIGGAASASAAPRVQFDLVCTGSIKDAGAPDDAAKPWSDRIAVDLAAGAYCEGLCEAPRALVLVEPGAIVFDGPRAADGQLPDRGFAVNRMTGEIYKRDAAATASGKCRPDKFTPFSHRLF
jgi:hypothetical protein